MRMTLPQVSIVSSRFKDVVTSFRRLPVFSGTLLILFLLIGVFGPAFAPHDPDWGALSARGAPGFWDSEWYEDNPRVQDRFFLGADAQGRDVLSRMIDGARISVIVVGIALGVGTIVGTGLGLVAGYLGGIVDELISRLWDIWTAVPFLLVALVLATVLGPSFPLVVGLLAALSWSAFVRNVRGEAMVLKQLDYVANAKICGAGPIRILSRHILPNLTNTVVVIATLQVGSLILSEAALSFLGVGIPRPQATWGNMVSDGRRYLDTAWWISFFPGVAIFLIVLSFNFIGDWLRDRWDPRLRQIQ